MRAPMREAGIAIIIAQYETKVEKKMLTAKGFADKVLNECIKGPYTILCRRNSAACLLRYHIALHSLQCCHTLENHMAQAIGIEAREWCVNKQVAWRTCHKPVNGHGGA